MRDQKIVHDSSFESQLFFYFVKGIGGGVLFHFLHGFIESIDVVFIFDALERAFTEKRGHGDALHIRIAMEECFIGGGKSY